MPVRVAVPVVIAAALLVGAASAQADQVLDQRGRPGASQLIEPAACRYFGTGGVDSRYLHLAVAAPTIRGVNVRRGRKDYSKARFAVWVSDVNDNYRLLAKSDWSYWMRVSDRRWSQWQGPATSFTANFRGAYSLEILVEWYRRGRLIGWRDARVTNFNYWDNFRIGPYGPFSFCSVAVTQYTAPP